MRQNKLESTYYRARLSIRQNRDGSWTGRARFVRKDTNESVSGGKAFFASTREQVDNEIKDYASVMLRTMKRPPDWESASRKVLLQYQALAENINRSVLAIEELVAGSKNSEEIMRIHLESCKHVMGESVGIVRAIELLSESQRLELLLSPEEVFKNPTDAWNLDDLSLRDAIFQMFIKPSENESALHEEQLYKIRAAMNDVAAE